LEHAAALKKVATNHVASLKAKDVGFSEVIMKTEEEYYNALTKLCQDHPEVIKKQARESSITLEWLKESTPVSHGSLSSPKKTLSESQTAQENVVRELQEARSQAVFQKEANSAHNLERLKTKHEKVLSSAVESHASALEKTRSDHAMALLNLQAESQAESMQLGKLVEDAKAGLAAFECQVAKKLEANQKEATK
jgi:hypothetical protein